MIDEYTLEKKGTGSISQRSFTALIWNYLGSGVRMFSQFTIGIILARLLGPEAFGIVAIGFIMVSIGNLIADLGLSAAVIQSKTLEEKDVRFAFTAQMILGATFSLVGYFSANAIAEFFHHATAEPYIQAMAFLFVLQAFGQTSGAMLRRALDFKAYQLINIASYLTGYLLVGIPCAYYGLGAWSLVTAQLVQSVIFSLVAIWHSKHSMKPAFKPSTPGMFSFGWKVIAADLSSWGIHTIPSLAIGRLLGVVNLGIYARAVSLVGTPINTLTTSLQGVLFAASSKAQGDVTQLKKGYFAATALTGLVSLPLVATVASVPETVITAIYGKQWLAAIPVLAPLALAMGMHALLAVVGPVLMAQNKVSLEIRAQLIVLLVMIPVLYFTARISLEAVAWGVLCIYILRWLVLVRTILPTINTGWIELLSILRWPICCAIVTAALVVVCDCLLQGSSPITRLIVDMITAGFSMFMLMRLLGGRIWHGAHGDFLLAPGRLPGSFRRLLGV
jgi:O-antigen/teichoic acid export membrane protein